uniref:Peroxisome assembly protein 12 n=1 Tax=Ciona savignyi TaxID=51511 RepID=H2YD37_CIOSA
MSELGNELSTALASKTANLPSPFEVLAQDNLNDSVAPAMKHVVRVLAQYDPQNFAWCYGWFDELFAIANLFTQQHFLCKHNSTFAEYYYELQRLVPHKSNNKNPFQFKSKLCIKTLTVLVLLPYLKCKFQDFYLKVKEESDMTGVKSLTKLKSAVFYIYPMMHGFWHSANLYYNFLFAIGKSDFPSPFYRMLNTKLIFLIVYDGCSYSHRNCLHVIFFFKLYRLCDKIKICLHWKKVYLTTILTGSVHIGVFLLQFIDWWFMEEDAGDLKEVMAAPTISAPTNQPDTKIPVPPGKICPLCNRPRRNEATLLTSGYVFCYPCIYKYVEQHKRCPVTGYVTNFDHLIRIFSQT